MSLPIIDRSSNEIFSFHLTKIPLWRVPHFIYRSMIPRRARVREIAVNSHPNSQVVPSDGPISHRAGGLLHAEQFLTMNLGEKIIGLPRYNWNSVAMFAWWENEAALERFLKEQQSKSLREGWHVRLKLYRKWGDVNEFSRAEISPQLARPDLPIVAVTLARLNLQETFRFIRWGRPVERQVRDHRGKNLALAAIRPLGTFSTFSIWKNEHEMLSMVSGRDKSEDGDDHKKAMIERNRRDFHHQFTTMRFVAIGEYGSWNGRSGYTNSKNFE